MSANKLENFVDFEEIKDMTKLNVVYFELNPVARNPGYRQRVLEIVPSINQVDHFRKNLGYKVIT
jgi:hypothetical protein